MLDFEVYRKHLTRGGVGPYVTVQRGGILSLTCEAAALLGNPKAVELLFDRGAHVMGFRGAAANVPHAYRVRPQPASSSLLVSGRAFTRHFGIPTDVARRYPATMIGDVLAVHLAGGGAATGQQMEEEAAR
jgi:hypothetical protein